MAAAENRGNCMKFLTTLLAVCCTIQVAIAGSWTNLSGTAQVIDGDTISIRQSRIRIGGIDACERDQVGTKGGRTWHCGRDARAYMRRLVAGRHLQCRVFDIDRYGRSVAQCFSQGRDVGLAMIEAGLAEAVSRWLPSQHPIDMAGYKFAETRARQRRLGIWSAEIESPQEHRRRSSSP